MMNQPSPRKFWRWFDPRYRQIGTWAFILNRITAIGLTVYLVLHLYMLSKLVQGPEAYDAFIALAKTPVILFGELLVIAAGLIHGLNGIRVGFNSFGFGLNRQRETFIVLMIIALAGTVYFAVHMFGWA